MTAGDPVAMPHWYSPDGDPPTFVSGEGAYVTDDLENEYLDFVSQLFCCNAGHSNDAIIDAMAEQAEELPYVSSASHNDVRSALASDLVDIAPDSLSEVYFAISGSEANEAAAQMARQVQDAPTVLTRWQSYHGATAGAGSFTGDPTTRATLDRHAGTVGSGKFLPPLPSAFDTDDPERLAERAADHLEFVIRNEGPDAVAAILLEPIAGASGAYPPPPGYLQRVRELCDAYDILLIADEVITGFGRCGEWFGVQTEDVVPDLLTFAKGVTSAYVPLAGVLIDGEVASQLRDTDFPLGQTYAGHPVACAAGRAAIDQYADGLIENVRERAPYLQHRLEDLAADHREVKTVRGRGFLWSVVLAEPDTGDPFVHPWVNPDAKNPVPAVRAAAREHGVLFGGGRPDIQVLCAPPLGIDDAAIDRAIDALDTAIDDVFG